jgi:hypothetical protein
MRIVGPLLEYLFSSKMMKQVGSYEGEFTKIVNLPFPTTVTIGQQYYFNPDETLDSVNNKIRCIELIDSGTNANSLTSSGVRDNLSVSQSIQGSLFLCNTKREVIATIPLYVMIRRLQAGKPQYVNIPENIIWQTCFIQFDSLSTGINDSHCVSLRVSYFPVNN